MISAYREDYTFFRLQRCGIHGFIDKGTQALADIKDALHAVGEGRTWFSTSFIQATLRRIQDPASFDKRLTEREQSILINIGDGDTDIEIAEAHNIALRTVQGHKSSIMRKLSIADGRRLLMYAHEKEFFDHSRRLIAGS